MCAITLINKKTDNSNNKSPNLQVSQMCHFLIAISLQKSLCLQCYLDKIDVPIHSMPASFDSITFTMKNN